MDKYYTRPCNFYFGKQSEKKVKKKLSLPFGGNKFISFDTIEIISRTNKKIININKVNKLNRKLKKKVQQDILNIVKKKNFKSINFSKIPVLMGVINITPDSFSDGGKFNNTNSSIKLAKYFIQKGCKIIDIGGESTRPGSKEVNFKIESKRVQGFLKKSKKLNCLISLDTRKSKIMELGKRNKLDIVNDVSGLSHDSSTIKFLKKTNIPFIINHSSGIPESMQNKPTYKNVLLDIYDFFEKKLNILNQEGIRHKNIIIDPGIGFGKNLKHNITLLKNVSIFHSLGYPVMLGISRKRFIKDLAGINDSRERIGGTISTCIWLMMQGVQILRVHDFNEVKQAIKVFKSFILK